MQLIRYLGEVMGKGKMILRFESEKFGGCFSDLLELSRAGLF